MFLLETARAVVIGFGSECWSEQRKNTLLGGESSHH